MESCRLRLTVKRFSSNSSTAQDRAAQRKGKKALAIKNGADTNQAPPYS